ncbi:uncharacterized protein LOC142357760 [Convolutriloba macropyga]|uniref:uncharacterized protein LOC142357760 n=1 Tax=Convolutriloba macropyga TaxID=536237 RepID=UPI003F523913
MTHRLYDIIYHRHLPKLGYPAWEKPTAGLYIQHDAHSWRAPNDTLFGSASWWKEKLPACVAVVPHMEQLMTMLIRSQNTRLGRKLAQNLNVLACLLGCAVWSRLEYVPYPTDRDLPIDRESRFYPTSTGYRLLYCTRIRTAMQSTNADPDPELAERYATLLATLANELLDCWKRAENGVMSIAAVGLTVDPEAVNEAQDATNAALGLLSDLFPAVISALHSPVDGVAMAMVPFLLAYMQRLKRLSGLSEQHLQHARLTLEGLSRCAMYPLDMPADASGDETLAIIEEIEETVAAKRREAFTLFRNIARITLSDTTSFVGSRLEAVIANPQASFQEVEIVVTLLYQIGEGASEEYTKPGCGVLGQMAAALMQAGTQLPHARHRLVAVAVLETFVRYCRVVQAQPALGPAVLGALLDDRGMGHSSAAVSTRACYLFQRLVRQLRSSLGTMLETILAGLEPHLIRIASTPAPQGSAAGGPVLAGPKGTHGKGPTGAVSYLDDRMYAFEAAGILLGGEDLPADRQLAYVQGLLAPLVQQVEGNMELAAKWGGTEAQMVQHALVAISHLSKGFTHHMATVARPAIGELLLRVLSAALQVPVAAPRNKALRARTVALLHRYVEVLGATVLPYMPRALEVLLCDGLDAEDTVDVMGLLVQLVCRFKENMLSICECVLGPLLDVTHGQLLTPSWDWSGRSGTGATEQIQANSQVQATGSTEDQREKAELQRSYYSMLHALCQNNLASALSRLKMATLEQCMQGLVSGASLHVDPSVRKICIQTLSMLVTQWLSSRTDATSWEAFPGFRRWAVDHVAYDACVVGIMQGGLDLQDAAVSSLLGEVATLLTSVHERCGDEFISALPRTGWPPVIIEQLAVAIQQRKDQKELKAAIKSVMQQLHKAQNEAIRTQSTGT